MLIRHRITVLSGGTGSQPVEHRRHENAGLRARRSREDEIVRYALAGAPLSAPTASSSVL
jgi:hypothetical protein